jgi:hypothetical protein
MRIVHMLGADALAALMAADREISDRASGKSSRAALAPNPSSTAMGEGAFQGLRKSASRASSASASRVSHSQITSADQPAPWSAWIAAPSR